MITIVGATGNVGGKIADILTERGEPVRLVARSASRLRPKVGSKAQAFAGDAMDSEFLAKAFTGADAVFALIPPSLRSSDFVSYMKTFGESIARALEIARVKFVVNLSSVGAELPEGTGPIVGLHNQEERLNRIKGLNILNLRPAFFMENLLVGIDLIKSKGVNGNAIRGDIKVPLIATKDIAAYAADRLVKRDFSGSRVRYLLGKGDLSMIDATEIIGRKINKPGLPYIMFPYDEAEKGMIAMGLSREVSKGYIEMDKAFNDGRIRYENRTPGNTTPTSFEEFCDEVFVPAYRQNKAA